MLFGRYTNNIDSISREILNYCNYSTMTAIHFIPCHHGVSQEKKKKKKKKRKKKKLGKERGGILPGREIFLVLNAQSNLCSKKVLRLFTLIFLLQKNFVK